MPGEDSTKNQQNQNKTITENIKESISDYSHVAKEKIVEAGNYVSQSMHGIKETVVEAFVATEEKLAHLTLDPKDGQTTLQHRAEELQTQQRNTQLEINEVNDHYIDEQSTDNLVTSTLKNIKNTTIETVHQGVHWVEEKSQQLKHWVQEGQVKTQNNPQDQYVINEPQSQINHPLIITEITTNQVISSPPQQSGTGLTESVKRGCHDANEKLHEGIHWLDEKGKEAQHYIQETNLFSGETVAEADLGDREQGFKNIAQEQQVQNWAQEKGKQLKNEEPKKFNVDLLGKSTKEPHNNFTEQLDEIQRRAREDDKLSAENKTYEQQFYFDSKVQQGSNKSSKIQDTEDKQSKTKLSQ